MLIRHGLPVRRELSEGIADPELAPAGHQQAKHLAEYLASEPIDAIYSSPLRRAHQTAIPLATRKGLAIMTVDDVAESDRNSSEYVPIEELKATNDPRWQAMVSGEYSFGEESLPEFQSRVVAAVEGLIATHPGDRIAVTCHGGVINMYLCHVLGIEPRQSLFYPNYTSIHRVAASRGGHRNVITMNETSHLRGTGLPMGLVQRG
ncbi:MAG: histidine phosphatase family protein [Actinomycetota bacterium]|nr:histidine phosphatase family protein [Actinomycetota bacterium]